MPKIFVDPAHACVIEGLKIEEKEKEEAEFQKKKEVFLMKNKYKSMYILKHNLMINKYFLNDL